MGVEVSRARSILMTILLMAGMACVGLVGYGVMWAVAHFGGVAGTWTIIEVMLAVIAVMYYRQFRGFGRGH